MTHDQMHQTVDKLAGLFKGFITFIHEVAPMVETVSAAVGHPEVAAGAAIAEKLSGAVVAAEPIAPSDTVLVDAKQA